MAELTLGYSRTAATSATMQNGSGDRETPSRSLKASLARSRSRMTLVISTSTALVSWALVCRDATIRSAIRRRSRVAGTTSSRRPWASGTATLGPAAAGLLAALLGLGRLGGLGLATLALAGLGLLGLAALLGLRLAAPFGLGFLTLLGLGLAALGRRLPAALAVLLDLGQLGAHPHGLVDLHLDALQHPRHRRGHLGVDLVGGDLEQRLVDLDLVALLLQPARDGALGDRLAELRHLDWCGHQNPPEGLPA